MKILVWMIMVASALLLVSCGRCQQCLVLNPANGKEVRSERVCDGLSDKGERVGEKTKDNYDLICI